MGALHWALLDSHVPRNPSDPHTQSSHLLSKGAVASLDLSVQTLSPPRSALPGVPCCWLPVQSSECHLALGQVVAEAGREVIHTGD